MPAKPLRLLFYVEHFGVFGSGAENYAVALTTGLAGRGYDVHVVSRDSQAIPGIHVHPGFDEILTTRQRLAPDLTIDWGLFERADLHRLGGSVHAEFLRYSLQAYGGARRWLKALGYRFAPKHRARISHERYVLDDPGTRCVAISEFVAEQARAFGVPTERLTVVHNAVNTERFSPDTVRRHRDTVRRELGVGPDDVLFLFVADNLKLKNLDLLRVVFAASYPRFPGIRLVVVGKRRPSFAAPYLIHAGSAREVERYYAAGDALLHPTYYDTFGSVVLEAMSCGLPVVVSQCAGASELVTEGVSGFCLPVTGERREVVANWCQALQRLLDPGCRRDLGQAGRITAERHTFEAHLDAWEALLSATAVSRVSA